MKSIACARGALRKLTDRLTVLALGLASAVLLPIATAVANDAPRLLVQSGPRAIVMPQLVIAPDKTLIASTGEVGQGSVFVWHVATGRLLCTLPAQLRPDGLAAMVSSGAPNMGFSADGATLATASPDGSLQIWDVRRCDKRGDIRVTERGSASGMLTVRDGSVMVLGKDDTLYSGDVFGGKPLRALTKPGAAGDLLHGVTADGRFALVSGKADGPTPFSGWHTQVIDTRTGEATGLPTAGASESAVPFLLQMVPPAASISASGRWVLRFHAGQVQLIDRSRQVVTGSASIVQALPQAAARQPVAQQPAMAPEPPGRPRTGRGCPPPEGAGPQAQARCDRLDQAMRTLGGTGMTEMRAAVEQFKQHAQQQGPAALMPPWFGFSEREDVVYIWRNPQPDAGAVTLRRDQRSVIDVRKVPDLALVRQVPVHDGDVLAPFLGATANGYAASSDGSMLALGLLSVDPGAGRLGVVDLRTLGDRAELRTWKPNGGLPAGLEWTSDNRLIATIYGQRVGATTSLAPRMAGPAGLPGGPLSGMPMGMPTRRAPNAEANPAGEAASPPSGSVESAVVQWSMAEGDVTTRRIGTTSPRPARLAPGGEHAAVMKLQADGAQPQRGKATIEIVATKDMSRVREIELLDDRGAPIFSGAIGGFESFALSADGMRIAAVSRPGSSASERGPGGRARQAGLLTLHDALTGRQIAALEGAGAANVEFLAPDGSSMTIGTPAGRQCVTVADDRLTAAPFTAGKGLRSAFFAGGRLHVVTSGADRDEPQCASAPMNSIRLAGKDAKVIRIDADASRLAVARGDGKIEIHRVEANGSTVRTGELPGNLLSVESMAFSPDGRLLASTETTGATSIWNLESQRLLARLFAFEGGTWAVVDPQGRFDTNDIEGLEHLHWVMPDDALRALPLEIFMRDYFSPGLLTRLVHGEPLPPVRPVADLNRAQPVLKIASIAPSRSDATRVDVTVEAEGRIDARGRAGGVVDVRLFRDGRLVGYPERRGEALRLDPSTRRASVTFRSIRLPQGATSVVFGAYAFNTDGVKSATVRSTYGVPKGGVASPRKGKAYIVAIGVNKNDNAALDLKYAANDARVTIDVLSQRIAAQQLHREVVTIPLISDGDRTRDATKARIRAVLGVLAGKPADRDADRDALGGIANASKLEAATPDDLVIVTFAGHGHAGGSGGAGGTGDAGVFYLVPQDVGGTGQQMTPPMLARAISTDELEAWLRDVDAGEMVMVIDACYSAASIEQAGFKAGPMGSRGLGQLAYDKGMRVLAAAQADDVSVESEQLKHGMLTFALMKRGLEQWHADFRPRDDRIKLAEWLAYGVEGVVRLRDDEAAAGPSVKVSGRTVTSVDVVPLVRQPRLFDYSRQGEGLVIESKR